MRLSAVNRLGRTMNKTAIAVMALILMALGTSVGSRAAELKVLATRNMRPILAALVPEFQRVSGQRLNVKFDTAEPVKRRISAGESADTVILLKSLLYELIKEGKIVDGSARDVARSSVVLTVRAGASKPDISSVETFKKAMFAASSIAFTDPTSGGLSGKYFAAALARLGIAESLKPKIKLVGPEAASKLVAAGGAQYGVDQLSTALAVSGVSVVGALPNELQTDIVVSAGIVVGGQEPGAAALFIKFLTSQAAAKIIRERGMEPG